MGTEISSEINKLQLALIYSSRIYTTLLMTLAAILVFMIMYEHNHNYLFYWLLYMVAIDCYRVYTAYLYSESEKANDVDLLSAKNHLITGMVLSGLGWGMCTVILYPQVDLLNKFILFGVVIGVATASTTTLSYKKSIALVYVALILLPFIAVILYVGKDEMILSLMVFVYLIFLVKNISVFYRNSYRLLVLEIEAKEREKELDNQRRKAVRANAAKSEFLANISHELRTPMHAILGFSELGMKKTDAESKEKLASYYPKIQDNGKRLLGLLNDLLDLSKLEAGKVVIDKTTNDLFNTAKAAVKEVEPLINERGLTIENIVSSENTCADYDSDKVLQVVINLLSNAIKFSPENSCITIYIEDDVLNFSGSAKETPAIRLSVADEGEGIPVEDIEVIFDKFVQLNRNDNAGGTGLGLSICQEIVEMHKGEIGVLNNRSGGATFYFSLPRAGA